MSSFLDTTHNLSSAQNSAYDRSFSLKRKRSAGPRSPSLSFPGWYARDDSDTTCSGDADSEQVGACFPFDPSYPAHFPPVDVPFWQAHLTVSIEQALSQCYNTDNAVYSCFPQGDTVIAQHQWVHFVCEWCLPFHMRCPWFNGFAGNSKLPQFHITNAVDIYLYNADSSTLIQSWTNLVNPANSAGQVTACVNDSWWGGDGANWNGENITSQYYFALTPTTQTGAEYRSPISTFAAVREYRASYLSTACTDRSV